MGLRLTRAKFLEHFGNRAPCLVGMEACGGAQHWARGLLALGHDVRLLPAKMVRPFVSGNKNDAHDAQAIWTGVQQPGVKAVAVKSEEQQGVLALHRMRQQLVKFRTAQINGLRGLLTEYGEVMPRGRAGMRRDMAAALGPNPTYSRHCAAALSLNSRRPALVGRLLCRRVCSHLHQKRSYSPRRGSPVPSRRAGPDAHASPSIRRAGAVQNRRGRRCLSRPTSRA